MNQRSAISHINKNGALLVFPLNNRKEPHSLWSAFFPRKKLRWEWDESGDNRVFDMWTLMKRLSENKSVVYSKWYQGRATFFSRELFTALVCLMHAVGNVEEALSHEARDLLDVLEQDSPLSTKELKKATDLQGRLNEAHYNRGMKMLFQRLLIVGFGEVDDGAFPSLAVGATKLIYEDLWTEALGLKPKEALETVERFFPQGSPFRKAFEKTRAEVEGKNG